MRTRGGSMRPGRRCTTWHRDGLIDDDAYYLLLAAIIEGADRVANTAGVYAAYIKQWQPNALRPFALVPNPRSAPVPRCVAHQADAVHVARRSAPIDLLVCRSPVQHTTVRRLLSRPGAHRPRLVR